MSSLSGEILSATGAGCATTFVGHPLDVVKVHLQTNPSLRGSSTRSAASYLLAQNALFRGIGPPLANAVLMNTVMFSVFSHVKYSFGDGSDDDNNKDNNNTSSLSNALLAGCLSGFATACVSTPTDYLKIQAQLHGTKSLAILQHKGTSLKTLFRGHMANLGREGTFTMAYLGLYDNLIDKSSSNNKIRGGSFWEVAITSSLTGGLAWVISYPFDTVKSIIQKEKPSVQHNNPTTKKCSSLDVTYNLWKQDGISAFYRGCWASTGRAMMVTSLRMVVYEFCMDCFNKP